MAIVDGTIRDDGGEVFDVRSAAFGAVGNGSTDDTAAIQAAIDAATTATGARGGIVFFPPGEYRIESPGLVLPRGKTLALVGAGPDATALHATAGLLSSTEPLVRWNFTTGVTTTFFRLQDLQLSRSDEGPVLVYAKPSNNQVSERLAQAVFENVYFRAKTASAPGGATADTVAIDGAINCAFRDVAVHGGNVGLVLSACSHCLVENFRTDIDFSVNVGMRVIGGGNHVFSNVRVESTNGGAGVQLESGTTNLVFDGLYFEGKKTTPQINIASAEGVTILGPALATPTVSNAVGLRVAGSATNVRVIGGIAKDFTVHSGGKAIKIESSARYVRVEGLHLYDPSGGASDALANVDLSSGAAGVRVELLTDNPPAKRVVVASAPPTLAVNSSTPSVSEGEVFKVANTSSTTITDLLDDYAGQEVTLIFTDAVTTVSDGTNLRLAGSFTSTGDAVLKLVRDGTRWYEVSRSVN
ncbi:MAG TPA: glycosyl hydrolase family 28-related protein [Longimicrobium sp.]|nr:glycosyl hydrolase family 28-related protein [Longimicrobium sp.]